MLRKFSILFSRRPSEAYSHLVRSGEIVSDEIQLRALPVFDRLYDDLVGYSEKAKKQPPPPRQLELRPPNRLGIVPSFFLRREQEKKVDNAVRGYGSGDGIDTTTYHPLSSIRGLYVWGGVGCGKTMLMDLLFNNLPHEIKKMRTHFHQFMLDVKKSSHTIRYKTKEEMQTPGNRSNILSYNTSNDRRRTPEAEVDLYDELAQRMISNVELLCFDEVAVSDVADAMIMRRLFNAFYKVGLVVIFTSNRAPENLYLGGLSREGFLPFIDLAKRQCVVYHMDSNTDYRLSGQRADTFLSPFSAENDAKFQKLFLECSKGMPAEQRTLQVFGRDVIVPRACGGVCYFHFSELCGTAMSTADYEVIATTFHTVFINGVPRFAYENSDVKNRFLLLIDTLYTFHCKAIIYAEVAPAELQASKEETHQIGDHVGEKITPTVYENLSEFERETGKRLLDDSDSSFQMERCISRLCEMRTQEYLEAPHRHQDVSIGTRMQ